MVQPNRDDPAGAPDPDAPEPTASDMPPSRDALARDLLDLWEGNLGAIAHDPEVADFLTYVFGLAGAGMSMMRQGTEAAARAAGAEDRSDAEHDRARTGDPTAGTTADDAAPELGGGHVDELRQRLAALEARLAALESGEEPGPGAPREDPEDGRPGS